MIAGDICIAAIPSYCCIDLKLLGMNIGKKTIIYS